MVTIICNNRRYWTSVNLQKNTRLNIKSIISVSFNTCTSYTYSGGKAEPLSDLF